MPTLAENKKAFFNYTILEKFEAGISLLGQEVKSLKTRGINLAGSYIVLKDKEAFWIGANIPPYQPRNIGSSYNPERSRKILLKKSEIKYLLGKTKQKGLTLMPLKVYTIRGKIKLEFAIVKGKRKFDKRESIKKRTIERDIERELKSRWGPIDKLLKKFVSGSTKFLLEILYRGDEKQESTKVPFKIIRLSLLETQKTSSKEIKANLFPKPALAYA